MTSTKTKNAPPKGYAGHKEGSRKATVHEVFDKQGPEAAFTRGMKLKLSENTLHSWFGMWRREAAPVKRKSAKRTATSKTAKPATSKTTKAPVATPPADQPEPIPQFLNG